MYEKYERLQDEIEEIETDHLLAIQRMQDYNDVSDESTYDILDAFSRLKKIASDLLFDVYEKSEEE